MGGAFFFCGEDVGTGLEEGRRLCRWCGDAAVLEHLRKEKVVAIVAPGNPEHFAPSLSLRGMSGVDSICRRDLCHFGV